MSGQIAHYRLSGYIGRGAMAVVYLAQDQRTGGNVALKVVAPELAGDAAFRSRFLHESRMAASISHPHIIPIYDADEAAGNLYVAMGYVQGGDARSLLNRHGPLPVDWAWTIIAGVASALDAAHAHGLIHGDVRQANMLLDTSDQANGAAQPMADGGQSAAGGPGHVYLSDFGMSRSSPSSEIIAAGQVEPLDYAAPEQIERHELDGRADLYSLACAGFELLCGTPPFGQDQGLTLMYAQLYAPAPSAADRRPDLPSAVDAVLATALAKNPADRFPTCGQFAEALRAALGSSDYASPGPSAPAGGPPPAGLAPVGTASFGTVPAGTVPAGPPPADTAVPVADDWFGPAADELAGYGQQGSAAPDAGQAPLPPDDTLAGAPTMAGPPAMAEEPPFYGQPTVAGQPTMAEGPAVRTARHGARTPALRTTHHGRATHHGGRPPAVRTRLAATPPGAASGRTAPAGLRLHQQAARRLPAAGAAAYRQEAGLRRGRGRRCHRGDHRRCHSFWRIVTEHADGFVVTGRLPDPLDLGGHPGVPAGGRRGQPADFQRGNPAVAGRRGRRRPQLLEPGQRDQPDPGRRQPAQRRVPPR